MVSAGVDFGYDNYGLWPWQAPLNLQGSVSLFANQLKEYVFAILIDDITALSPIVKSKNTCICIFIIYFFADIMFFTGQCRVIQHVLMTHDTVNKMFFIFPALRLLNLLRQLFFLFSKGNIVITKSVNSCTLFDNRSFRFGIRKRNISFKVKYSRLSLSRSRRDLLNHFEISVLRHIRFIVLRKNQFEQPNFTNDYVI